MNHPISAARPKVSVCMITYNHEKFIVQAIESVLQQDAEFSIELVIGDDASKDGTPALLAALQAAHPERIKLRLNTSNMGMMGNLQATLGECEGQYIAMLEGDDYWSDPGKLRKQIALMDATPTAALSFHPVQIHENGGFVPDRFTREVPAVTTIRDLAHGNYMHTCSVVYRAGLFAKYPESFATSTVGDYFMHMLHARHGDILKLPETMAVYRVHSGGVWSSHKGIEKKVLQYLECMIGNFDEEIDRILIERHASIAVRVLFEEIGSADDAASAANLARCLKYHPQALLTRLRAVSAENTRLSRGGLRSAASGLKRVLLGTKK